MVFVQELLRPFVSELGEIREELGAERARREMAEFTLREGMAEEQRRREKAERERDELREELYALREPRESPQTVEGEPERAEEPHSATVESQEPYRDRGGGECSEDEREGPWDVEAYAKANLWAPRPIRGGARSGTQHRRGSWRERMRWPSR